jgi:hypothetical protein
LGAGSGGLLDINGEIGRVSMSVIPWCRFRTKRSPNPPPGWRRRQISCPKGATSVSTRFMRVNWIGVNLT